MRTFAAFACLSLLPLAAAAADAPPPDDPYLWLEDVTGEKPLAWVRQQNAVSQGELEASPDFKPIYDRLLSIYDSRARIPYLNKRGEFFYNFWRDPQHVRGIWRRTTLAEYRKPEPAWETVLDLDALAAAEKENWVWKGATWLEPGFDRVLLNLSRGGADATVTREFDPVKKAFVPDGFVTAEAKSDLTWRDRDTLYIGTDFGAGSLTDSGYPRVVKEWKRGTPLAAARLVYEGQSTDVAVGTSKSTAPGFEREFLRRFITFYSGHDFLRIGDTFTKLDLPEDANSGTFRDFITVELRSEWKTGGKTYPAGALLAQRWDKFLAGERNFDVLFQPAPRWPACRRPSTTSSSTSSRTSATGSSSSRRSPRAAGRACG
jgi:prolyl oligopeptidase